MATDKSKPIRCKSPESIALRAELVKREWRYRDLAEAAGLSVDTVKVIILEYRDSNIARHLIEKALNTPIWSTALDFAEQNALIEKLGFDPFAMPRPKIRATAKSLGIRIPARLKRDSIFPFLQKNAKPNQPENVKQ
jgi:lambda repressor-like predicted transcriptional regulator